MVRDMRNSQSGPGWEPAKVSDPVDGYVDYDLTMTRMSRASQDYDKHPLIDFDESNVDDAVKIVELCQEKGISLDDLKKAMEIQEMIEDQNTPEPVPTVSPMFDIPDSIPITVDSSVLSNDPLTLVDDSSTPVNNDEHKDHGIVFKTAKKAFSIINPIGYEATKNGLAMGKAFGETVKNVMDKNNDGEVSIGEAGRSVLPLTPAGAMADAILDRVYDDKDVAEQVSLADTELSVGSSGESGSGYDIDAM